MSGYTPSLAEAKQMYVAEAARFEPERSEEELGAEFDRTIAAVKLAAAAEALRNAASTAQAATFPTGVNLDGKRHHPLHISVRAWLGRIADGYQQEKGSKQ